MSIENHGQFNQAANAALEKNKTGKIESRLAKTTISQLVTVLNSATKPNKNDTDVIKQSKEKLSKDPKFQQEVYNFITRSALSR